MASTPTAPSGGGGGFAFPRAWHFPPMYTIQPNEATRRAQMDRWEAMVLAYCAHHRIFRLSLSASSSPPSSSSSPGADGETAGGGGGGGGEEKKTTAPTPADEIFHNRTINRQLSPAAAREVVEHMRRSGTAEYVSASSSSSSSSPPASDVVLIYWRSADAWAALLEAWVEETGQRGGVLTVYEIVEGEGSRGSELRGIDADVLRSALAVLERRGKAQVFGADDSLGVKFF